MKTVGIDYGQRKAGIALSEESKLAFPIGVIKYTSEKDAAEKIASYCKNNNIERIVIGLPVGIMEKKVKSFGNLLFQTLGIQPIYQDESYSTKQATQIMSEMHTSVVKRNAKEDAIAAALILNAYLEDQAR